jgi:hypothetical protein
LERLGESLRVVLDERQIDAAIERYWPVFESHYQSLMRAKVRRCCPPLLSRLLGCD